MTSATALRVRTGWCLGSVILISVLYGCDGSDTEQVRDDNYAQVRSGLPVRLDVLENDPNDATVACVSPSNAGGYIELDQETGEIRYTSPPDFVGRIASTTSSRHRTVTVSKLRCAFAWTIAGSWGHREGLGRR